MHVRRFVCFLLGAWLAGSILVIYTVRQNTSSARRVLSDLSPEAAVQFKGVPQSARLALMSYQAAEQNRRIMLAWDNIQLVFGAAFFLYLLFGSRERKFAIGAGAWMLLMTFVERVFLTPEIVALGRLTDFLPAAATSGDRTKMEVLQYAYAALEILKWAGGLALAVKLLRAGPKSSDVRQQLDVVDKSDHRHVDR